MRVPRGRGGPNSGVVVLNPLMGLVVAPACSTSPFAPSPHPTLAATRDPDEHSEAVVVAPAQKGALLFAAKGRVASHGERGQRSLRRCRGTPWEW